MSANRNRALAVKQLMEQYEDVSTEFVQAELGCGRGQASRAIRQARYVLADDGKRVSYATPANEYSVALEGDADMRVRSYLSTQKGINTRRLNVGRVMAPSADHGRSSAQERTLGQWALADQHDAEADRIRLQALQDLLGA